MKPTIKEIVQAREVLTKAGYCDGGWNIEDVKEQFNVKDDEEAMFLLKKTLTNDYVISQIWESMDVIADVYEIETKES